MTLQLQAMSRHQTHMFCHLAVSQISRETGFKVAEIILPLFASFSVVYINSKSKRGSSGIKALRPTPTPQGQ